MVTAHQDIDASPAAQVVGRGLERNPLPSLVAGELEQVVTALVKKALSDQATWPGGLPITPVCAFGPSTPPLDVDELEKQLVDAAETRRQSDCTDFEDSLGTFDAGEINPGNLMAEKNHSPISRSEEPVTMGQLKYLLQAVLEHRSQSTSDIAESDPVDNQQKERVGASKPDYKIVIEKYSFPTPRIVFQVH
jgi:hypothetical protein